MSERHSATIRVPVIYHYDDREVEDEMAISVLTGGRVLFLLTEPSKFSMSPESLAEVAAFVAPIATFQRQKRWREKK